MSSNKIGAWGNISGVEELLDMPVVRKHVELEWLSKITASQFKAWVKSLRDVLELTEDDVEKHDVLIQEEIDRREQVFQLHKEKRRLEKERDVIIAEKKTFEREYKRQMLYKPHTFDLVATPATRNAFWTGNGRIHPKDKYDNLSKKIMNDMTGTTRYDKFEKHVKKYGI